MFQKPQQTKNHFIVKAFKSPTFNTNTPWYGNTYDTEKYYFYKASRYNSMPEVVSSANVCIRFNGLKYTVVQFLSKQQHVIIIYSLNSLLIHSQKFCNKNRSRILTVCTEMVILIGKCLYCFEKI